jgi:hypothetical protein
MNSGGEMYVVECIVESSTFTTTKLGVYVVMVVVKTCGRAMWRIVCKM